MMDFKQTQLVRTSIGNGLVAKSDIDPGNPIIYITQPYIAIAENNSLERVCAECLYDKESLKRCSRCKVLRYCSQQCQEISWKTTHKHECAIYKSLQPRVLPTEVRAVLQVLLRYKSDLKSEPPWRKLVSHEEELRKRQKRWNKILLQAKAAVEYGKLPQEFMGIALALLCRMAVNAFRVTLADDSPVGICFDPTLSLANHFCNPNAFISFDGRNVSLRALTTIKKEEQIFISYVDTTQARETRQAKLKERYFFACDCTKCKTSQGPYNTFLHSEQIPSEKLDLFTNIKDLKAFAINPISRDEESQTLSAGCHLEIKKLISQSANEEPNKQFQLLKTALLKCEPCLSLKAYAYRPIPIILRELSLHFLSFSAYSTSLSLVLFKFLNCDVFHYPQPHHPTRVTILYTIASLLKTLAESQSSEIHSATAVPPVLKEIIENIDFISAYQAVMILVLEYAGMSHGVESRFVKTVEEELKEVEEVQKEREAVGELLKRWQVEGEGCGEGRKIADKLFGDLRGLAGCALVVLEGED